MTINKILVAPRACLKVLILGLWSSLALSALDPVPEPSDNPLSEEKRVLG